MTQRSLQALQMHLVAAPSTSDTSQRVFSQTVSARVVLCKDGKPTLTALTCCSQTVKQAQPAQAPQRSIHSLKQRLAPYGFQQRCDGFSDNYNDKLCMDNLFERHWKYSTDEHSTSHYESCYINLDPSPIHLPPLPTQQRVQPVTVVHADGSEAPVTYGIPIDWNATNQQLMDGVRRQCDLPGDKQVVLVQLDRNLFGR